MEELARLLIYHGVLTSANDVLLLGELLAPYSLARKRVIVTQGEWRISYLTEDTSASIVFSHRDNDNTSLFSLWDGAIKVCEYVLSNKDLDCLVRSVAKPLK